MHQGPGTRMEWGMFCRARLMERPKSVARMGLSGSLVRNRKLSGFTSLQHAHPLASAAIALNTMSFVTILYGG